MNGKFNLEDIPQPKETIGCQDLLTLRESSKHGMLRKRSNSHLTSMLKKKAHAISKLFKWAHRMVVISAGCVYVYKSELDKKPYSAFTLFGFNKIEQEKDVNEMGPHNWVMKVIPVQYKQNSHYFACTSEREMKEWMKAIRREMKIAHNISLQEDDSFSTCSENSLTNIEEQIYESGELGDIPPIPSRDIHQVDTDSEDGEDYNEIDPGHMDPLGRNAKKAANPGGTLSAKDRPLPTTPGGPPSAGSRTLPPSSGLSSRPPPAIPGHDRPPPDLPSGSHTGPPGFDLSSRKPPPLPSMENNATDDQDPNRDSWIPVTGTVQTMREKFKPTVPKKPQPPPGAISVMPGMPAFSQANLRSPTEKSETSSFPETPPRRDRHGAKDSPPPPLPAAPIPKKQVPPVPKGKERTGSAHSSSDSSGGSTLPYSLEKQRKSKRDVSPVMYEVPRELDPDDYYSRAKFDDLDKEKSSRVIKDIAVEGVFLIRPGNTGAEQVLVVYAEGDARKYKVNNQNGQYWFNTDRKFDTLNNLLVHYMNNDLPKRSTRLTKPYKDVSS